MPEQFAFQKVARNGRAIYGHEWPCGFLSQGRADAIVSGLGLLAMHVEMQQAILEQAFVCLRDGGRFIQFTYGPQAPVAESVVDALGLTVRRGDFVLRNVPPATVYVYEAAARH